MVSRRSVHVAFGAFLALLFSSAAVSAQAAGDAAAARTLFTEARTLVSQGKYAEACPKFEESLRLNRGIGTQFNLADCWEHVGRTASAWGQFLEAAAGARAAGQTEREEVARQRAQALEPKLARMTLDVQSPSAGQEILRNGVAIGAATWKTAVPVDPGKHELEARAPGKAPWRGTVDVPVGPATVPVTVPPLVDAPSETAPPVAEASTGASSDPTRDDGPQSAWSGQRTLALVAAGVGVAGLAVGTIFFFDYRDKNDAAKAICRSGEDCPEGSASEHADLVSDAKRARTVTYVGWGVGVAGLAGAAALWLTAPAGASAANDRRLPVAFDADISPDRFELGVRGSW
jgi:hypothetical protein